MTPAIRRIYERRAAAAGLTMQQWLDRNEAEFERRRIPSRSEQLRILKKHVRSQGKAWL